MIKVNIPLGLALVPRLVGKYAKCENCYFFNYEILDCDHVACIAEERGDRNDVIYKLVKNKYEVKNEREAN